MRLSIRVKLFIMINSLVLLLVALLMIFTTFFIDDIFIYKYEDQLTESYIDFSETYEDKKDMKGILGSKELDFKGFVSIFDEQLKVKKSSVPGQKLQNQMQPEFRDVISHFIDDSSKEYDIFVMDALHGEGDTMLLVGKLNESDYIMLDKPLNYIVEVVEIINSAMLTFLVVLFALSLIISYLTSFAFTKPIFKIRKAVNSIAKRDFSYELIIKNNDELGDLGKIINEISDQIRDSFDEIEAQNEMLDNDKKMLEEINQQLQELSETDPLTKLNNRLKVDRILDYEMKRNRITGSIFSVIILDIDHFKLVNDTFGHLAGDNVLVEISEILTMGLRRLDVIGRWGGEEFIIVLPDTVLADAIAKAEKLRELIQNREFEGVTPQTASFGVGEYHEGTELNSYIKSIDDALYIAKETGRNRVEQNIRN